MWECVRVCYGSVDAVRTGKGHTKSASISTSTAAARPDLDPALDPLRPRYPLLRGRMQIYVPFPWFFALCGFWMIFIDNLAWVEYKEEEKKINTSLACWFSIKHIQCWLEVFGILMNFKYVFKREKKVWKKFILGMMMLFVHFSVESVFLRQEDEKTWQIG